MRSSSVRSLLAACAAAALLAQCPLLAASVGIFPFDGRDATEVTNEILDSVRQALRLDVLGEVALESIKQAPNEELFLKNLEGVTFKYHLLDEDSLRPRQQEELTSIKALNARLEGMCAIMPADYWSYEWCHKREVSQFHVEQRGNKFVKSPNWSLGKYHKTLVVREKGFPDEATAPIIKMVDYYKGGQRCDETDEQRSVEVHVQCCDGSSLPDYTPSETYFDSLLQNPNPQIPRASLNVVSEPQVCSYRAVVCTPWLCPRTPRASAEASPVALAASTGTFKSYVDFMRQIENMCLVKPEDWWTYELCFSKGVRQIRFHVEQSTNAEGAIVQKQVLVNQYTLGQASVQLYKNESALAERSTSLASLGSRAALTEREEELVRQVGLLSPLLLQTEQARLPSLSLLMTNGTPCDLDARNRSTVVDIQCGSGNQIVSIKEVRTCEYSIKVHLLSACLLPGFLPHKDVVTPVGLVALGGDDDDDDEATVPTNTDVVHAERVAVTASVPEPEPASVGVGVDPARADGERAFERVRIQNLIDENPQLAVENPELLALLLQALLAIDELPLAEAGPRELVVDAIDDALSATRPAAPAAAIEVVREIQIGTLVEGVDHDVEVGGLPTPEPQHVAPEPVAPEPVAPEPVAPEPVAPEPKPLPVQGTEAETEGKAAVHDEVGDEDRRHPHHPVAGEL